MTMKSCEISWRLKKLTVLALLIRKPYVRILQGVPLSILHLRLLHVILIFIVGHIWDIPPQNESICSACSVKWLGAKWASRRSISILSQPSISWRIDNDTQDWINKLAQVCLRSWNLKSLMSALSSPTFHALLSSTCIFPTAGLNVPSGRVAALVCTNTHRELFPIFP